MKQNIKILRDEKTAEAISLLVKATKQKYDSEMITNKANEMLEHVEMMGKKLQKVDTLVNNMDSTQALVYFAREKWFLRKLGEMTLTILI